MHDWVYLTKHMLTAETEMMLIPSVANIIHKPKSRLKRSLFFTFDVIYYVGRAYFLR